MKSIRTPNATPSVTGAVSCALPVMLLLGISGLLAVSAPAQPPGAPTVSIQTFPLADNPLGLAFDGANIWVALPLTNSVAKLQASDGTILGTFPAGESPRHLVFDGANIWVTDSGHDSVTELRANDGALLGTFHVGGSPTGITFDGANIWVTNQEEDTVTKLRASDGARLGTF